MWSHYGVNAYGLVSRPSSSSDLLCIGRATTTIIFSEFELSAPTFAFGIISLLSSLMSIGFGVGLIYVLGDVRGDTLKVSNHSAV